MSTSYTLSVMKKSRSSSPRKRRDRMAKRSVLSKAAMKMSERVLRKAKWISTIDSEVKSPDPEHQGYDFQIDSVHPGNGKKS